MAKVDEEHSDIELYVVVLGGAADRFCEALALKDGSLTLGIIQGWRPLLYFHVFGSDPWAESESEGARLETLLAIADSLVLTDSSEAGRHYSASALERMERALHLGKPTLPTAVFGSAALAEEWGTLTNQKPRYVGDPVADNAMPALKELLRAMLRSTVAPPSTRPPG